MDWQKASKFENMKWLKLILVVFLCLGLNAIKAQTWLGKDLSNINVKELTASQREEVLQTAKRQGLNEADLEAMARARGLNVDDLRRAQTAGADGKGAFMDTARDKKKVVSENVLQSTVAIYGQELFENNAMGFAPSLNLAPTAAYILGPNDKLSIRIFGLQEQSMNVVIATNGSVVIPYGGKVMLSGLTLSEAERVLTNQLKKYGFASLGSGGSHLKIQITDFRTIQVMVWGGKQSGAYYLPSLATAFHALFVAGGPGFNRSYRNIHVIRNGKTLRVIDLYEFLSKGSHSSDITLQDNDIVFIPYYDRRVRLRGEVKTPAVFELLPNENLFTAIQYAGGYTEIAYKDVMEVLRYGEKASWRIFPVLIFPWCGQALQRLDRVGALCLHPVIKGLVACIQIVTTKCHDTGRRNNVLAASRHDCHRLTLFSGVNITAASQPLLHHVVDDVKPVRSVALTDS